MGPVCLATRIWYEAPRGERSFVTRWCNGVWIVAVLASCGPATLKDEAWSNACEALHEVHRLDCRDDRDALRVSTSQKVSIVNGKTTQSYTVNIEPVVKRLRATMWGAESFSSSGRGRLLLVRAQCISASRSSATSGGLATNASISGRRAIVLISDPDKSTATRMPAKRARHAGSRSKPTGWSSPR